MQYLQSVTRIFKGIDSAITLKTTKNCALILCYRTNKKSRKDNVICLQLMYARSIYEFIQTLVFPGEFS